MPRVDLTGRRFGRLLVVAYDGCGRGGAHWQCRCDCGGATVARASNLRRGQTRSCGCLRPASPGRPARVVTYAGVTDTIAGWARRLGLHRAQIDAAARAGAP